MMRALRTLLVASVGALAAAGCAGPDVLPGRGSKLSAFERSVRVIEGWSTALRTGHVQAAAVPHSRGMSAGAPVPSGTIRAFVAAWESAGFRGGVGRPDRPAGRPSDRQR